MSDHAPALETSTGLDSRKLAIWTFIGSECLFFASLISNYLVHKGKSLVGPFAHEAWTDPATGKVDVNGTILNARDGAAISDEEALRLTALEDAEIVLVEVD